MLKGKTEKKMLTKKIDKKIESTRLICQNCDKL
jgi:hypothetical protein